MRTCSKCGETFPETAEYFYRHGAGLRPDCKQCRSRKQAEHYVKHRDRRRATNRAWREANPEKVRAIWQRGQAKNRDRLVEYKREWRRQNLDKAAAYCRRWRARHRERANAIDRAYRERTRARRRQQAADSRAANRIRFRAYQAKRRSIIRKNGGTFDAKDIARLHEVQGGRCRWCSVPLTDRFEIDHVMPLKHGGSNAVDNLALACPTCNRRKSSLIPFEEWTPPHPLTL